MAAIQPKNTDIIHVNRINEKTAASHVNIHNSIYVVDGAEVKPVAATINLGTSTAAEHFLEGFFKEITSNGQALTLGTDSNHDINLKQNALTRFALSSTGLAQDSTNGVSITMTKASTGVVPGVATTGLTATGSAIGDAFGMTSVFNHFTTVAASTGCQLWDAPLYLPIIVVNSGANALALYPHDGTGTLNGGVAGAAVSLAANSFTYCVRVSSTNWICREITSAAA